MKTIYKITIAFFLLLMSCNEEGLTKAEALALLKQADTERTMQVEKGIYIGKMSFKRSGNSLAEINYLNMLKTNGVIKLDSLSTNSRTFGSSNRTEVSTLYNIEILDAYKQYITKTKGNISYVQILFRETKDVTNVKMLNEKQAIVTVQFEKINTPFYAANLDNSYLKNRNGIYAHDVKFRYSDKNGWSHDWMDQATISN